MTRRRQKPVDQPGQDSFLDIVANLVGILIILVMVIGVRAKDAMVEAAPLRTPDEKEEKQSPKLDLAEAKSVAAAVESDIHQVSAKIEREEIEVTYRRKERDKIQLLIATAEEALNEKRNTLDTEQQEQFDLQRDVLAARDELRSLKQSLQVAENSIAKTEVIEHLPTPMAKTVFGKEIHFRLRDGRLAYVPMDEFVEKFQADVPQQMWRLKDRDSFTETIGPINGFLIKYEIKRSRHATATRAGTAVRQRVGLEKFTFLPTEEPLGEPLAQALQPGSRFQSLLTASDPDRTTITVWTYPDSFNEFRTLKKELFARGYLTASRPLPDGIHISGSPHGTRSAAQ